MTMLTIREVKSYVNSFFFLKAYSFEVNSLGLKQVSDPQVVRLCNFFCGIRQSEVHSVISW